MDNDPLPPAPVQRLVGQSCSVCASKMRKAIYFDMDAAHTYWECKADSTHPHVEMEWPFTTIAVSPRRANSLGFKVYQ